ncbi:MAG TPA: hypothetical protein PKZ43_05875 [Bacteroidales bacterium]|nr:hypothetical protein [Bacteroidales bacterium]HQI46065.1 hypothetical protein [Bacteroidales bacterium]
MSTLEIRNKLIENIFLIEDKSFLEALKTIVDTKLASTTYELSDFQIDRIKKGREQLMNGNTISNDTVQKKVGQLKQKLI